MARHTLVVAALTDSASASTHAATLAASNSFRQSLQIYNGAFDPTAAVPEPALKVLVLVLAGLGLLSWRKARSRH